MKDKRTLLLMSVLLALLGVYLLKSPIENYLADQPPQLESPASQEQLLPGENEIRKIDVAQGDDGYFYATVHYFFRGDLSNPKIRVMADSPDADASRFWNSEQLVDIQKGENSVRLEVLRPATPYKEFTSKKIVVSMNSGFAAAQTTKEIDFPIEWTDSSTYMRNREFAKKTIDELYAEAVELIDLADARTFQTAKKNLERVLIKDPQYIDAYPELARFSMKNNWGPEGLKQAETYLISGLKLNGNHANSHVLLGYVYVHQRRFDEAKAEFETAEKIGTKNLWLWANWGELHAMQGESQKAIDMYLRATDTPRPYDTYDRARLDAYLKLFRLLTSPEQLAKADELYRKRADEYPSIPCFRTDYAAFRLERFDDYQGAIAESRKAIDNGCESPRSRQVMGLANYVAWSNTLDEQREAYLSQAQLFFPESPRLIYQLARSQTTNKAIGELKKRAVSIDSKDNENFTALAYALIENDVASARRLIELGADPMSHVGDEDYPVAMAPIFYQHKEGVQLMLESGIDLSAVKYRGISALGYAEQLQNPEIIHLIKSKLKI